MPTPDDELRELFAKGRAEDRAQTPSFDAMWEAARARRGSRRLGAALALAAAAVIAIAVGWIIVAPGADTPPLLPNEQVAKTNPLPDLPSDAPPSVADELMELAAWEPTLETPTDFLLEEDGVLSGGLPSSDLSDPVLDLDELTMEL